MIAKSSAVMTTAVFIVMNMFNLIISGTINLLKILSVLILTLTIIMIALVVAALILIPTPVSAMGWALWGSAATLMTGTIIPNLVIFTIIRLFVTAISSVVSPPKTPPKPTMKKKKK